MVHIYVTDAAVTAVASAVSVGLYLYYRSYPVGAATRLQVFVVLPLVAMRLRASSAAAELCAMPRNNGRLPMTVTTRLLDPGVVPGLHAVECVVMVMPLPVFDGELDAMWCIRSACLFPPPCATVAATDDVIAMTLGASKSNVQSSRIAENVYFILLQTVYRDVYNKKCYHYNVLDTIRPLDSLRYFETSMALNTC